MSIVAVPRCVGGTNALPTRHLNFTIPPVARAGFQRDAHRGADLSPNQLLLIWLPTGCRKVVLLAPRCRIISLPLPCCGVLPLPLACTGIRLIPSGGGPHRDAVRDLRTAGCRGADTLAQTPAAPVVKAADTRYTTPPAISPKPRSVRPRNGPTPLPISFPSTFSPAVRRVTAVPQQQRLRCRHGAVVTRDELHHGRDVTYDAV